MAKTVTTTKCARCGDAVSSMKAVAGGRLIGPPRKDAPEIPVYCSTSCLNVHAAAETAARVRCASPYCSRYFVRERGVPGRPKRYCGDACQKQHARMVESAYKALGKGRAALPGLPGGAAPVDEWRETIARLCKLDDELVALADKLASDGGDTQVAGAVTDMRRLVADRVHSARQGLARARAEQRIAETERAMAEAMAARNRARVQRLQRQIDVALAELPRAPEEDD